MSYERNLTFKLRIRGLSEPEITEVLSDVRAHEAAAGTSAVAEFGTAEEYAKQFPKKKRRTPGRTITTVGAALAIAYILLVVVLMLLFRIDIRDVVGPITLMPAGILILTSILAGFLTDYFRPAQTSGAAQDRPTSPRQLWIRVSAIAAALLGIVIFLLIVGPAENDADAFVRYALRGLGLLLIGASSWLWFKSQRGSQ